MGLALVPERWWASPPHLPLPDRRYWHFRMVTVFGGDGSGNLDDHQVVDYLRWTSQMRSTR